MAVRTSWMGLLAALLLVGCVSKSNHQSVLAQLEECRSDKSAAQEAASACEERFDREITRFDTMDSTLSDVLPATLREFEDERGRILELVPVQVQEEVSGYMDELSDAVGRGFRTLQQDNLEMMAQLSQAQTRLEGLGASSEDIGRKVQSIGSGLAEQNALRADAAEIAEAMRNFDSTLINCKDCEDRLRLNRKEREAISNFHAEIIGRLASLAAVGGVEEEGPDSDPEDALDEVVDSVSDEDA